MSGVHEESGLNALMAWHPYICNQVPHICNGVEVGSVIALSERTSKLQRGEQGSSVLSSKSVTHS